MPVGRLRVFALLAAAGFPTIAPCGCGAAGAPRDRVDADEDGVEAAQDCDDHVPEVHPGAEERCDGIDNDCDGVVEDHVVRFVDRDGDGWGDPRGERIVCGEVPPDLADDNLDCDDGDPLVHPDADEPPCGGVDLNCDGIAPVSDWVSAAGGPAGPNLQWVLEHAGDGRELTLCPGTYVGPFVVEGAATLRSVAGAEATTLVGGDPTRAVVTAYGSVVLEGLTITGGEGGLVLTPGVRATVRSSRIVGNHDERDLSGYDGGGGVRAEPGSIVELVSTEVSGNSAAHGGGGLMLDRAIGRLVDSTVAGNDAYQGGGVHVLEGSLDVERSTVLGNTARYGGGLYLSGAEGALDSTSRIIENAAVYGGGGVAMYGSALSGGAVEGNTSEYEGGGVMSREASVLRDVAVRNNIGLRGGGVNFGHEDGADLSLPGCSIEGNSAEEGGGLYVDEYTAVALVLDGTVRVAGNVATSGGGVFFEGIGTLSSDGAWWGQLGLDANEPDDIRMGGASHDAEGFATFDCASETGELVCTE